MQKEKKESKSAHSSSKSGLTSPGKPRRKREKFSREERKKLQEKAELSEERYERLLRLQAEFDNYRKRMSKEKSELSNYIVEDLILEFLPIMDNFERAISAAEGHDDVHSLLQGVEMIYKQMQDILTRRGLSKIEALHKKFDPREHEAIMHVENEEHPEETVIEEHLKGYKLKDKVIRPAMVKVSKKPEENKSDKSE